MPEVSARGPLKRIQIEATVIRADGTVEPLGVISDSSWRWRYGPGRFLAWLRIRKSNRRH